jgi:hypothetical protein
MSTQTPKSHAFSNPRHRQFILGNLQILVRELVEMSTAIAIELYKTQPKTMTDIATQIQEQLDRLHWSEERAVAHMIDHYDWKPIWFHQLDDDELTEMMEVLQGVELVVSGASSNA